MRLDGRVAIVTGAGTGIGRAIARLFAAEGAAVVCAGRRPAPLHAVVAEVVSAGGRALAVPTDVSRADDVDRLVQATVARFGRVDVLVNNAATAGGGGGIARLEEADWDRVIANNLKSVYLCTRAVVPHMVAQSRGAIVNVSSILAVAPFPGTVAYSTAKAGLLGFTRAVALDLAPRGIRVNLLVPGSVDTDMMGWADVPADQVARLRAEVDASIPRGRIGAPEEIAHGALFLASDESSFMVGTSLLLDGGTLARNPQPR